MTGSDKTLRNKKSFLKLYAETGTIQAACDAVYISRDTYYRWYKEDKDFMEGCRIAQGAFGEKLENEALRRAHDGWDEPVFYRGQMQGQVHKYSDVLLIFLMKGAMPNKYRERHEVSGPDGGPVLIKEVEVRLSGTSGTSGTG